MDALRVSIILNDKSNIYSSEKSVDSTYPTGYLQAIRFTIFTHWINLRTFVVDERYKHCPIVLRIGGNGGSRVPPFKLILSNCFLYANFVDNYHSSAKVVRVHHATACVRRYTTSIYICIDAKIEIGTNCRIRLKSMPHWHSSHRHAQSRKTRHRVLLRG